MKNIRVFYLKKFSFLEVKFSMYLNRCVFVMYRSKNAGNTLNYKVIYNEYLCLMTVV